MLDLTLKVQKDIYIEASAESVWDALINPDKIAEYLYGTQTTTDWQPGSTINFDGNYEGTEYHDKGIVKEVNPPHFLVYHYWSQFGQVPDIPENYSEVRHEIKAEGTGHRLFIEQIGFSSEIGHNHTNDSWDGVLERLKAVAERG